MTGLSGMSHRFLPSTVTTVFFGSYLGNLPLRWGGTSPIGILPKNGHEGPNWLDTEDF